MCAFVRAIFVAILLACGCATTFASGPSRRTTPSQSTSPRRVGPSPEELVLGRGLFQQGALHVRGRRWWAALDAFRCSQRIVDHPLTSYNIARVLFALGRHVEALEELEHFSQIENISVDETWRAQAEEVRAAALADVAHLALRVEPSGAIVSIDGIDRGTVTVLREFTVLAGRRVVEVRAPGHAPRRETVRLTRGERRQLTARLTPTPSSPPGTAAPRDSVRIARRGATGHN